MTDAIAREIHNRIHSLAVILKDCAHYPADADIIIATRIAELSRDYVRIRTPKIDDECMRLLFSRDPGPSEKYLNFMTLGDFYQLIDCIADIKVNVKALGEINGRFGVLLSNLDRAINLMNHNFSHFVTNNAVKIGDGDENARQELLSIMTTVISDLCYAVSSMMRAIFEEYSKESDNDRQCDLGALGASCSAYMKMLGFDFKSHKWDEQKFGQKDNPAKDIGEWRNWGSMHCGKFFAYPLYIAWYNPVDHTIYETIYIYPD